MIITSAPCSRFFKNDFRKELLVAPEGFCEHEVDGIEGLKSMGHLQIEENEAKELINQKYTILFLSETAFILSELKNEK